MISDEGTGLGDIIAKAAAIVGVTEERLSAFLGKPCGCGPRREKFNQLGSWAYRVAKGKVDGALEFLDRIIGSWG